MNVGIVIPRIDELHPLPAQIIKIVSAYKTDKCVLPTTGRILIVEPASLKIVNVITA